MLSSGLRARFLFWAVVALLAVVLGFFSLYQLTETPPTWYDEGANEQVAMNETLHAKAEVQIAPGQFISTVPWVTTAYPALEPVSWSFDLFGIGLFQARIVMVLFIFLCTAAYFGLVYGLFGPMSALGALLLLVTFAPLYGQGKNVLGEVPGLFYLAVALFSLWKLQQRKYDGTGWYALAAVAMGLCIVTKPIFILLVPALALAVLFERKSIRFDWSRILVGFIAFLVPLALWVFIDFWGHVSLAQVLSFYLLSPGEHNLSQVPANILIFFRQTSPLYFLLCAGAWIVAYGMRKRAREPISLAESLAFVFSMIVWIAFLRTAGYYRYFFPAEIPVLAFLPNSLYVIVKRVPRLRTERVKKIFVACVVFALFLFQLYPLLFTSWIASHATNTSDVQYQEALSSLSATTTVFVYNIPQAVIFLPSQNYYQYLAPIPPFQYGTGELSLLEQGTPDVLIIGREDWNALATTTRSKYEPQTEIGNLIVAERKR